MVRAHELGPLEMRVLGLLHEGETSAVGALRDRLASEGAELAYTTVMTVLSRLHDKGLVERRREGSRYLYSRAKRAPHALESMLASVRTALSPRGARPLLTLLEEEELSAAELRELRRAIDRKLGEKSGKP
jgi:predicted transcriptional regulator